jgi:hypothetical protein
MTRAQFALVLYRYEGRPPVQTGGIFSDVPARHAAFSAITWAHNNGIVTGTGNRFLPENNMTRAQMVLMLYRYSLLKEMEISSDPGALNRFTDRGSIPSAAMQAMRWAVTNGLLTGSGDRLLPNDNITRAQVVLILHRFNSIFYDITTEIPVDESEEEETTDIFEDEPDDDADENPPNRSEDELEDDTEEDDALEIDTSEDKLFETQAVGLYEESVHES